MIDTGLGGLAQVRRKPSAKLLGMTRHGSHKNVMTRAAAAELERRARDRSL